MKKFLSIFLVVLMMINISACLGNAEADNISHSSDNETSSTTQQDSISYGKIENGKITDGTPFYKGTALVKINDTVYNINKKGEILFKLDYNGYFPGNGYVNGLLSVSDGFYNEKGELITPKSVGVDKFYDFGLEDGYILASVDESSYNSTSRKLGIMDTSFEWTVQPTEELYESFSKDGKLFVTNFGGTIYYSDGYLYYNKTDMYLEFSTGKYFSDFQGSYPEGLKKYSHNVYDPDSGKYYDLVAVDAAEKKVLSEINNCPDNLNSIGKFINNKAFVTLYNSETNTYYFSLMSKDGKLLFDPIKFPGIRIDTDIQISTNKYGLYDGQYIMIQDGTLIKTYDNAGKLLGQFDAYEQLSINKYCKFSYNLSDGVVCIEHIIQTQDTSAFYYFNPDFTPLF